MFKLDPSVNLFIAPESIIELTTVFADYLYSKTIVIIKNYLKNLSRTVVISIIVLL